MKPRIDTPPDDAAACDYIAQCAATACRRETASAAGRMVWHCWEPRTDPGRPLVLLHGGSGSWTHWIHTPAFFRQERAVLVADLPGLGDSPDPPEPYDADSIAAIVTDGIEQLTAPGEAIDLVGFSFGGIIAGHVAAAHRLVLHKLVIVGAPPFGLGSSGPTNEVRAVDAALDFDQARELHRHNLELFMIADASRVDALALRIHHDNLRRSRLRSRKIARAATLEQVLRKSTCSLSGIWGERDVTAWPDLDSIRALFVECGGDFATLPGIGHWAAYEAGDAFNRLLAQHLHADG